MYYKFSNNDLLEEGLPYKGMFRLENDVFLKGYTETSELSADNTFINNFYLAEKNFDNIFGNIENVEEYQTLPFDTINKQYFTTLFEGLNDNNLSIFKSLVTINPEIFNRDNVRYYNLSSVNTDLLLSNGTVHSDGFGGDDTWGFLSNVMVGALIPTSESTFKYICTTGTELFSLSGSFVENSLAVIQEFPVEFAVEVQNIGYNEGEERLYILQDDQILIYDGLLYKNCDNLVLLDSIRLEDVDTEIFKWTSQIKYAETFAKFSQKYLKGNPNNPKFIKFGNSYRTSIDDGFLFITDKYSSRVIESVDLRNSGIEGLITANIREFDDKIAVLHTIFNGMVGIYLSVIEISPRIINTHKLRGFIDNAETYNIDFCKFDSDLVFLANDTQYQIRSLTNPEYPLGKILQESLKYLPKFKFGDTYRKFGNPLIKWSSTNMNSNNFEYITSNSIVIGNKSYHIILCDGRFYVITQNIEDFYKFRVNRNLYSSFIEANCSKSSFGMYLNDAIYQILNDIIALQNQAHCKYQYLEDSVVLKRIDDLIIDTKNLYLAMNEKIHATNFQRIVNNILTIQRKMISISES